MGIKEMSKISKAEHDELCCVYAALLLHDDKHEITADKMNKVIAASGNTVEAYYPDFFTKYFKNVNLDNLLQSSASVPSTGAATTSAPVEEKKDDKKGGKDDKRGGKKEAPKKAPKKEESSDDMGMGGGL